MQDKSTTSNQIPQQLVAGMNLKNDTDIEFFGIKKNKTVQFLRGGHVYYFGQLPPKYYVLLLNKMYADKPALAYFKKLEDEAGVKLSTTRKVELYTYYLYGSLDHKADIQNGILQPSENFRDKLDCPSLSFSGKDITIDGQRLTLRDLTIIDMSARECTDFEIAEKLNIAMPTLDFHKKKLFIKTGTHCKLGLVSKSYKNQIL